MASQDSEPSTLQWKLELKDLPILRRLGRGFSGYLYETTWNGTKHARKDFPLGSEERNSLFEAEVKPLFNLDHPNITKCFGYTAGKSSCSLLQEYVHDNLQNTMQGRMEMRRKKANPTSSTSRPTVLAVDEIKRLLSTRAKRKGISAGIRSPIFEVPEAVDMISQVATAMKYLHDSGVVHGDLKPRNVLLEALEAESGAMKAKVADFGLTETKKRIDLVSERSRQLEILTWKAPERFEELLGPLMTEEFSADPFTEITGSDDPDDELECFDDFLKSKLALADVYSFGLTCSYILGGKVMFPRLSLTQLRKQRMRGFKPELPSACPEYLKFMIYSCLESEPSSRPCFYDICAMIIGGGLHLPHPHMEMIKGKGVVQYVEQQGSRVASSSGPETSSDITFAHDPIIQAVPRLSPLDMEVKNYADYAPNSDESDEGLTNLTKSPRGQRRPRGSGKETQSGAQTPAPSVGVLITPGLFKSWQHTRILAPVLQKDDRTNQVLLRRCIDMLWQIPNLQCQAGLTNQNEAAVVQTVGQQGPRVVISTSKMNQFEDVASAKTGAPLVQESTRVDDDLQTAISLMLEQEQWRGIYSPLETGSMSQMNILESSTNGNHSSSSFTAPVVGNHEAQSGAQTTAPRVGVRTQGPFKSWRHTRILAPVLQKNDRTNQELLRRCIDMMKQIPNLQQAGVTNQNEAAHDSFDQPAPPRVQKRPRGGSRIASMGPVHTGHDEATMNHMVAERRRRVKQKENFTALRGLVPITSKPDKASILGDTIEYLKDLQEQIQDLEASRNEAQRRFESLQVSYKDLEESRNKTQRRFESLQVSYKDLKQQKNELEARAYSVGLINQPNYDFRPKLDDFDPGLGDFDPTRDTIEVKLSLQRNIKQDRFHYLNTDLQRNNMNVSGDRNNTIIVKGIPPDKDFDQQKVLEIVRLYDPGAQIISSLKLHM